LRFTFVKSRLTFVKGCFTFVKSKRGIAVPHNREESQMTIHPFPSDFAVAFPFHADSGHGWMQVGRGALSAVGMKPSDFSRYSYRSGDGELFYLEEDCDAGKFCRAYEAKFGKAPQFLEHYQDGESFIRSLPHIA
jgi:hypothetical protein